MMRRFMLAALAAASLCAPALAAASQKRWRSFSHHFLQALASGLMRCARLALPLD